METLLAEGDLGVEPLLAEGALCVESLLAEGCPGVEPLLAEGRLGLQVVCWTGRVKQGLVYTIIKAGYFFCSASTGSITITLSLPSWKS